MTVHGPLHVDELPIDEALVRALVKDQLPALAGFPLSLLPAQGSSNALFRLGSELLVRLPRQPGGSVGIAKEARWGPAVGSALPVAVPEVVVVGEPGHGYPERWSVVRWLDGATPTAPAALASDLAELVLALRGFDVPTEALHDPALRSYRGEDLRDRDADTRADLLACRQIRGLDLDLDGVLEVWDHAMELPLAAVTPSWLHGDLVAENLLVRDGRVTALLDLGGLAVGDPTVDLAVAWDLLDRPGREAFRQAVGADDDTWLRARGWALGLALMTLPYYWTSMPQRCAGRIAMLRAVLEG